MAGEKAYGEQAHVRLKNEGSRSRRRSKLFRCFEDCGAVTHTVLVVPRGADQRRAKLAAVPLASAAGSVDGSSNRELREASSVPLGTVTMRSLWAVDAWLAL